MENSIYEVSRVDYATFVEQIKPECRDIKVNKKSTDIYSKQTGKILCSRVAPKNKNAHEKYYIFNSPEPEERCAPIPKFQLNLETKEEVQAFFNFLSNQQGSDKND